MRQLNTTILPLPDASLTGAASDYSNKRDHTMTTDEERDRIKAAHAERHTRLIVIRDGNGNPEEAELLSPEEILEATP